MQGDTRLRRIVRASLSSRSKYLLFVALLRKLFSVRAAAHRSRIGTNQGLMWSRKCRLVLGFGPQGLDEGSLAVYCLECV
jgi:hypothetical protein